MKIQEKHFYHGAALTQIVEHESFKALNRVGDKKNGHYQVNQDTRILVKYRTGINLQFTFTPEQLETLLENFQRKCKTFLVLVCGGEDCICALDRQQIEELLSFEEPVGQQWIKVERPPDCGMRVSSALASLKKPVPVNKFPNILFG